MNGPLSSNSREIVELKNQDNFDRKPFADWEEDNEHPECFKKPSLLIHLFLCTVNIKNIYIL